MFLKSKVLLCSLLGFSFYSSQIFAEGNSQQSSNQRQLTVEEINNVKEMLLNKPLMPYSVNIYGLLASSVNFADTSRNNTPDFAVVNARAGIFVAETSWSGKLELEFVGNQPPVFSPLLSVPYLYLEQSSNNTVNVRQAQINFDFWAHSSGKDKNAPENTITTVNSYVSRFSIGGIRIIGAVGIAPLLTYTPSNYSRQDGFYLAESFNFGKNIEANIGGGIFNTLYTTTAGKAGQFLGWGCCYFGTTPSFLSVLGVTSSSFSKAFMFNAAFKRNFTDKQSLSLTGYYGFQNKAAVLTNPLGFSLTTRNVDHIEASAVYNNTSIFGSRALITGNGVGFWFEDEIGGNQAPTPDTPPTLVFQNNDGYNNLLYGIGIAGDTSIYFSNIIKDADRFLYALAATYVVANFKEPGFSQDYTVTQVTTSVGYGYKTLELTLAASYATSPQKAFLKYNVSTGALNAMNNNFKAILSAALFF